MYYEAYGNSQKNVTFIAIRFKKPIVKLFVKESPEIINTENIMVVYSKKPIDFKSNSLIFGVKNQTGIQVPSGKESDLLLSLFDKSHIYLHVFHNSILYVVGKLSFEYEILSKNLAFNALSKIVTTCLSGNFTIEHFKLCKYFKRNNLEWKKWHSWWYLVKKCVNMNEFIPDSITLQLANKIAKIFKKSQQDYSLDYSELYKCEIELCEKSFLGVLYNVQHGNVTYVSPMIVSKNKNTFKDVNFIQCKNWLPLYFNKISWLSEGVYYYLTDLKEYQNHVKGILSSLNGTNIEKYRFIEKDLRIVDSIIN